MDIDPYNRPPDVIDIEILPSWAKPSWWFQFSQIPFLVKGSSVFWREACAKTCNSSPTQGSPHHFQYLHILSPHTYFGPIISKASERSRMACFLDSRNESLSCRNNLLDKAWLHGLIYPICMWSVPMFQYYLQNWQYYQRVEAKLMKLIQLAGCSTPMNSEVINKNAKMSL